MVDDSSSISVSFTLALISNGGMGAGRVSSGTSDSDENVWLRTWPRRIPIEVREDDRRGLSGLDGGLRRTRNAGGGESGL